MKYQTPTSERRGQRRGLGRRVRGNEPVAPVGPQLPSQGQPDQHLPAGVGHPVRAAGDWGDDREGSLRQSFPRPLARRGGHSPDWHRARQRGPAEGLQARGDGLPEHASWECRAVHGGVYEPATSGHYHQVGRLETLSRSSSLSTHSIFHISFLFGAGYRWRSLSPTWLLPKCLGSGVRELRLVSRQPHCRFPLERWV